MPETIGYIDGQYALWCEQDHPSREHMPTLRRLAASCSGPIVEFGVQYARSTAALLVESTAPVIGYDLHLTDAARRLEEFADGRLTLHEASTLEIEPVDCEMLFVDSLHTYAQVRGELERHADGVSRLLVFHDTTTFGCVAASCENPGGWAWTLQRGWHIPEEHYGIRMAIDELMVRDRSWRLVEAHHGGHGLLVLERK